MRRGIPGINIRSSPPIQLPSPMETHLWYVKPCQVRSDSLLSQYWDILSPCEKETVLRMRGDELRKSALISRALVRTTIARYQMNSQEAYVKALGRGFSGAPFKTFTIRFNHVTGESVRRLMDLKPELWIPLMTPPTLQAHWQFLLLELAGFHYAAICTEKHCATEGKRNTPVKLTVWKTTPCLEDEQVSGIDNVKTIHGLPMSINPSG